MSATKTKYKIYELSARAIIRNAKKDDDGEYQYHLNEEATRKCIAFSAPETQDDCALFYQTMAVLHKGEVRTAVIVEELKDITLRFRGSSNQRILDRADIARIIHGA